MKERGVLMQPDMALASYEDRKTNTRRIIDPQPFHDGDDGKLIWSQGRELRTELCPYGLPGDRLWVREPWRTAGIHNKKPPRDLPNNSERKAYIWYEADGKAPYYFDGGKYRHARFMCRWMSRTLLELLEVRIERLQNISDEDAVAEGMVIDDAKYDYQKLWDRINGKGAWDANPYVWVVVFKRINGQQV